MWVIEVLLEGNPLPAELCRVESAEKVAALVLALCNTKDLRPFTIRRLPD